MAAAGSLFIRSLQRLQAMALNRARNRSVDFKVNHSLEHAALCWQPPRTFKRGLASAPVAPCPVSRPAHAAVAVFTLYPP